MRGVGSKSWTCFLFCFLNFTYTKNATEFMTHYSENKFNLNDYFVFRRSATSRNQE